MVRKTPPSRLATRGLVSAPAPTPDVVSTTRPPPQDLADVVASFWTGTWDLRGQAPHETQLLGDPCVHVVFEGGDRRDARIVGVWTRLWRRTLEGRGFVRGAKLRAGAGRAFFPGPVAAWTNRIVPLREVVGSGVAALARAVLDVEVDPGLDALATWLRSRRRSRADEGAVSLAVAIVDHVRSDPELVGVEQLAKASGVHTRVLQRLFREHVGASPKVVIRRFRLQEAAERITQGKAPRFSALAAELGYADQAHLARDLRAVTGMSPTALAERFARTKRRRDD